MTWGTIHEDILFRLIIPEHETACELRGYFDEKTIPWNRTVGFCTDWAPSMAGRNAGVCTLVMNVSPSAIWTRCMICREQLSEKELSTYIGDIREQVNLIVNYINPHPLRTRLFTSIWRYDRFSGNTLLKKIKGTLKQHNVTPSQSHFCEIKLST